MQRGAGVAHRTATTMGFYTDMLAEAHHLRTLLGDHVNSLTPHRLRTESPAEREAARQRVMQHVTE